ncbi:MAG: ABC transporter ATP-binding protein [Anaerolineae bacterium]|nr:ABC transporter ATP-binding protein [Anaerolineae bacterium]
MTVISTQDLVRRFGDVVAVNGLTFDVERGEVFGFLGHNGAGKTTTVRLLNGVLSPTSGTMRLFDLDPVEDGPALRRRVGVLTESPSLDERLTARENLKIYAELYDVPAADVSARVDELLGQFDLSERADSRAGEFSKGMKQRLALARALIHRPELLFLDEPTSGLDPMIAHQVHELIAGYAAEGRTVFMCTHNLYEAQRLCDRVAVLEHGHLLAQGTPHELASRYARSQRLEIEATPATLPLALKTLNKMSGIEDVEAQNHSVISCSGATQETIPDIVALLVAGGVRIVRVTPLEASLEDVYFALHEHAAKGAQS